MAACTPLACGAERTPPTAEQMLQLWEEPADLPSRDLTLGPGGSELVPGRDVAYRFKSLDTTGHSRGYDVEDPEGRKWDVKIGEEAQSEIAASRILWAIGYRQPVNYYVASWRMSGGPTATPEPGRFRLESDHVKDGDWSWSENPFVGTRPYCALIVVNLLLNNWDLTTDNNRIYRLKGSTKDGVSRWFVVQDLGAALGKTRWPLGTRNDLEDFESQALLRRTAPGRVEFDYHGRHTRLLRDIVPADVAWACRLLSRLSDPQLHDAFRAAGYPDDVRKRFVRKIQEKIREGLALEGRNGSRPVEP